MAPQTFIQKWKASTLTERSGAQSFFNDLCQLIGEQTPAEADPEGMWFTFEAGASKTGGGDGWADVWRKGCFAWEFKGKHKDLDAAYKQLKLYASALGNPPLLIDSDFDTIRIHTNFTYSVDQLITIPIEELDEEPQRRLLKMAFNTPEELRPEMTREAVTQEAASQFTELADRLRGRGHDPQQVAHFLTKVLFCLFAEDIGVLPPRLFTRLLETALKFPPKHEQMFRNLFESMATGGFFGVDSIDFFNGGLFDGPETIALELPELRMLHKVSRLDWSAIEPSIFGTLFERGLDPEKRSQLGAHYTDAVSIMRIVEPVVLRPLREDWEAVKVKLAGKIELAGKARSKVVETRLRGEARDEYYAYLDRLHGVRVLDPACGSGNFLYLALMGLKDLEHQVHIEAESFGVGFERPLFVGVDPGCVMGIELNPYAAELARVTVWIGHLQWSIQHSRDFSRNPVLKKLDQVECRDAVLTAEGGEAEWPKADFIVGNPPFLGNKKMISELGEGYSARLRAAYEGRLPGGVDLVTYWFEKARAAVEAGAARRAGLVATNSIRGGANRTVLERIRESGKILAAYSDEEWVVEGAAVRVSIVCFAGKEYAGEVVLDEKPVAEVFADLTAGSAGLDLTRAKRLKENWGVCFQGVIKAGAFEIEGDVARRWLVAPRNPNGGANADVLRPWVNGMDITRRPSDMWIIDFGVGMSEQEAAFYEEPFRTVERLVRSTRATVRREGHKRYWWRFGETRPGMRNSLNKTGRYIATARVAKHRVFAWMNVAVLPDCQLFVIAREDDTTFGILHSRFHEEWALRLGTSLEDRPRYTATTTFETYPFPEGLTPNVPVAEYAGNAHAVAIGEAARRLNELRENWLNPPDLVVRIPEVVEGYPERVLPKDAAAADVLKTRTLTNLYNQRPAWLRNAHAELDAAVAAAYGWPADISIEDALERLLAMNLERAERGR